MKIVNVIVTIIIGLLGLYFLISSVFIKDVAYVAAGWAMLTYAKQELLYDDIREIKDEIKKFKK